MLSQLEEFVIQTLENFASTKFLILVIATVFFYIGKLDASTWQQTVLMVAGLRAVNEVSGMVADIKTAKISNDTTVALAALKGKKPVDNPDEG